MGKGRGAMEWWAEQEERKESVRRGNARKREEWMGEVGDGGKEGAVTRGEGLGGVSEDGQRLKKNSCYQPRSVFAFISVHTFPPHLSDSLCHPTLLGASRQSRPAQGTISGGYHFKESLTSKKEKMRTRVFSQC